MAISSPVTNSVTLPVVTVRAIVFSTAKFTFWFSPVGIAVSSLLHAVKITEEAKAKKIYFFRMFF